MSKIKKLHQKISSLLSAEFTKEFLQKSWLPFVKHVLKECGESLREKGLDSLIPENLKNIPTKSKDDILNAVSLLFADLETYCCFREKLSQETLTLWDALVFNDYIGFGQAYTEYKIVVQAPEPKSKYVYYNRTPEIRDPFKMLPCKSPTWSYGYSTNSYFYLPRALREILIKYYEVPAWAELSGTEQAPEGGMTYSDPEQLFLSEYYRLQVIHKQGRINYTGKLRPSASGLPKLQKTLKILEFFPNTDIKRYKLVRTNMLASVLPYLAPLEKKHSQPHQLLRDFFQNIYTTTFPAPPVLLPDIKGFGYIENTGMEPFGRQMLTLLESLPENNYVPIKNILGYYTFNLIQIEPVGQYDAYHRLSIDWENQTFHQTHVKYDNYKQIIQLPSIRGAFFFFAALGLCDLIYEAVDESELGISMFSPWDRLIAVRRTPLGDYVCGLTETYEAPMQKARGLKLSDDALLIKLDSADSPFISALDVFAEQTGPLTFKTDSRYFLKSVQRKEDLNTKIELFKEMVSGDLPKNWEDFFNTLRKKVDPLKLQSGCIVFNLDKANQELVRLLAQDPVIKPLISKAEGYLIIVPKNRYPALRQRLAEFGYLQT